MIGRGEERAVSTVIGAVLMLGILVSALALYQVNVVPDENQAVEYEHHQAVQGQLLDVRNGLVNAPDRRVGSYSVSLGTTYPPRSFTVNPPPSSGSLALVKANESIRLENATVTNEDAQDYWNTTELAFETGGLVYQPNYNEFRNAPTVVYENSVLYNVQDGNQATLTDQRLIDGNAIRLVTLAGNYSSSRSGTTALDFETVSASENAIDLESDGNVTLTIPTTLGVEKWERLLEDEPRVVSVSGGSGSVEITLEKDDYQLQVSKVALGDDGAAVDDAPAYLTVVDEPKDLREGETTRMTVEVRDRYNNPVSDDRVNATTDGEGVLEPRNETAGRDGRVTFEYTAGSSEGGEKVSLEATITSDPDQAETVSRTIAVSERSGNGSSEQFYVTDLEYDNPIKQGETFVVLAEITNNGVAEGAQSIALDFGSATDVDRESVRIGAGERKTVHLQYSDTDTLGERAFTVRTEDDSWSRTVIVESVEGPYFDIEITGTNDPVVETETLVVDAAIENIGNESDTQRIELTFDGSVVDSEEVSLDPDETRTVTLEYETTTGDSGDREIAVSSSDVEKAAIVTVEDNQPPAIETFTVSSSGGTHEVTWEVSDVNDDLSEVQIELRKNNDKVVDSTTRTLDGTTASGTDTLSGNDGKEIWIIVTDERGNRNSDSEPV